MSHRGPDASRVLDLDGTAAFGHARLSIIDLSERAHQPMSDGTGRFTVTYNGELYNYLALRKDLEDLGHHFRTTSDTEVVVESFARWGIDCFRRFNGMFALGIWDRRLRELVLARDRFGEKPVYYGIFGEAFAFASELRALRAAPHFREEPPGLAALNHFLALGYILAPLSVHPGVRKLEPASYVRYRPGAAPQISRYWNYGDAFRRESRGTLSDCLAELRHHLDRAVSERLVADVPVGTFLSGGLDSSSVTAYARRHAQHELHTFSIGFEQRSYDESSDARAAAAELGTVHHEVMISRAEGRAITERATNVYDEPFSDTSLVPMVHLSALASKYVKVVLCGDGADELFAGYVTYRADRYACWARAVPRRLRARMARTILSLVPETRAKMNFGFKVRQFARGVPHDFRRAHYSWRELHDVDERIGLLGKTHEDEIRETDPFHTFRRHYDEVADLDELSQHLYVDAKTWLADDILVKLDRATMAASLEGRAPFLDHRLAEYVASLPPSFKLGRSTGKVALRRAVQGVVPEGVLRKRKSGFNAPVHDWFAAAGANEHRFLNQHVACVRFGADAIAWTAPGVRT